MTFLLLTTFSFGQKFMVQGKDTLPYKDKLVIQKDTLELSGKVYYPGDTLYEGTCETFEKVNEKIVNQTDDRCSRKGLWVITDSSGNYWTGNYKYGDRTGLWERYNKSGKLLYEKKYVSVFGETTIVKEIDYSSGQPVTIMNKSFLGFYLNNLYLIMAIFFISFFTRPFINSRIYNVENGTNISLLYFGLPFTKKYWGNFSHSMTSMFTFWFSSYKPENRKLVLISNTLSVIALGIFFGIIIGLATTGELK